MRIVAPVHAPEVAKYACEVPGYASEVPGYASEVPVYASNICPHVTEQVPGSIVNQFAMDEHDQNFRIATTYGRMWGRNPDSVSNVFVLGPGGELQGKVHTLGVVIELLPLALGTTSGFLPDKITPRHVVARIDVDQRGWASDSLFRCFAVGLNRNSSAPVLLLGSILLNRSS